MLPYVLWLCVTPLPTHLSLFPTQLGETHASPGILLAFVCSAVTHCCGPCTASPTSTSSDSSCLDSILITVATNYQASPRPPG
ncbi:hypothetical protein E2C01_063356 [Portunus trituberculatus]|uniref:Secreted protein n=1 Tax=Portunus trituberculatus TaxID=210409 RepID=A0A5B7H8Y4_PORTR|nr:hypothetical protein [Portunus trituberculatus]